VEYNKIISGELRITSHKKF